jgi:DNA-binding winged helix-turn-helix (wHTH) protein
MSLAPVPDDRSEPGSASRSSNVPTDVLTEVTSDAPTEVTTEVTSGVTESEEQGASVPPTAERAMVVLVDHPAEAGRLAELRDENALRLVLVEDDAVPPIPTDAREDWVRKSAPGDEVDARIATLIHRARTAGLPPGPSGSIPEPGSSNVSFSVSSNVPEGPPTIDDDGIVRVGDRWVAVPPVESRLLRALIDRFGAVVSRESLGTAGWTDGIPGRNALDVHILRLRRRVAGVGLAIRTIRSRGYLLEHDLTGPSSPRPPGPRSSDWGQESVQNP